MNAAIAADLRTIADRIRGHRDRAIADFVRFRLRNWAEAVEREDQDAIVVALKTASAERIAHPWEGEAYNDAAKLLRRALEATRAA